MARALLVPAALLFITTGRQRAATFRRTARSLAASKRWAHATKECELAVSMDVRSLERIATGARWTDLRDDEPLTLPDVLRRAREPYDRRRAIQRASEEKREAERTRLLHDPEALREHIREQYSLRSALEDRLDETGQIALALLLDSKEPINGDEYEALLSMGRQIADHLPADHWTRDPDDVSPGVLAGLAGSYRSRQRAQVDNLMVSLEDLPLLRRAMQRLDEGALLKAQDAATLESEANRQWTTKDEQLTLRNRYLDFHEREARARAREQGLTSRFLKGTEPHLEAVDNEWLRFCEHCDETLYPGEGAQRPPTVCPYCGGRLASPEFASETPKR